MRSIQGVSYMDLLQVDGEYHLRENVKQGFLQIAIVTEQKMHPSHHNITLFI